MMKIHDICERTGLTRKAVEYYIAQELIFPDTEDNGYRAFTAADEQRLRHISVLRRLGLSIPQIRAALEDKGGSALQMAAVQSELELHRTQVRQALLNRLCEGASFEEIDSALAELDMQQTAIGRLTDAFPGYLGRFLALHFAPYLSEPVTDENQRAALDEMICWLDKTPPLPEVIREFLDAACASHSVRQIQDVDAAMRSLIADPDAFAEAYRRAKPIAEMFHASPAGEYSRALKEYFTECGYYDHFLPALRRMSPAYAAYSLQLQALTDVIARATE